MGKATPFEGELDAFGNPCCGQSFMGGTICTDAPGHSGGCSTVCQNCGDGETGDVCPCYEQCARCDDSFVPEWEEQHFCTPCVEELREVPSSLEPAKFGTTKEDWCDKRFAIWRSVFHCRRFPGHDGPHGCGGAIGRKDLLMSAPFTEKEEAEVLRSLLGNM